MKEQTQRICKLGFKATYIGRDPTEDDAINEGIFKFIFASPEALVGDRKWIEHEVLVMLMTEVCAILNSRPIAAIDTDPSSPMVLSPNILLTQKQGEIGTISDHLSIKDMYSASWKHVQVLSDMFWKKWRATYLESLQRRRKWCSSKQNLKTGDIVLLREKDVHRNMWPLGIVERPIESNDRLVRKAVIRVVKDGKVTTYTRPIAEMVLLLE